MNFLSLRVLLCFPVGPFLSQGTVLGSPAARGLGSLGLDVQEVGSGRKELLWKQSGWTSALLTQFLLTCFSPCLSGFLKPDSRFLLEEVPLCPRPHPCPWTLPAPSSGCWLAGHPPSFCCPGDTCLCSCIFCHRAFSYYRPSKTLSCTCHSLSLKSKKNMKSLIARIRKLKNFLKSWFYFKLKTVIKRIVIQTVSWSLPPFGCSE